MNNIYRSFVDSRCKDGDEILKEQTARQAHLLHMAVGISGEAGELLDAIKKHAIYQKELDMENVEEELGDLMFYITGLMNALGIRNFDYITTKNQQKLTKRYSSGSYSNEEAQTRADKGAK